MQKRLLLLLVLLGCSRSPVEPVVVTTPQPTPSELVTVPPFIPPALVVSPAVPDGRISGAGRELIYEFEVGGGKPYYDRFLSRPTVPPAASGITVGIGFDCGYNTEAQILRAWAKLPERHRLAAAAGLTRDRARAILPKLRDIQIEWPLAEEVFNETTLTDFLDIADQAFPGMEALHPNAQAVLVSLVFNRGGSMKGDSRREMREVRDLVPKSDYTGMASAILRMKRLWPDVPGLLRRRDAEARLMGSCAGR